MAKLVIGIIIVALVAYFALFQNSAEDVQTGANPSETSEQVLTDEAQTEAVESSDEEAEVEGAPEGSDETENEEEQ